MTPTYFKGILNKNKKKKTFILATQAKQSGRLLSRTTNQLKKKGIQVSNVKKISADDALKFKGKKGVKSKSGKSIIRY